MTSTLPMPHRFTIPIVLVAAMATTGCDHAKPAPPSTSSSASSAAPAGSAAPLDDVVAVVNGVAITTADVALRMKQEMHVNDTSPERRKVMVDGIIRQELLRQRAAQLGLDQDPLYKRKMRAVEAQLASQSRIELGEAFYRHEIGPKAEVTESDARAYFDAHAAELRTEVHVEQILVSAEDPAVAEGVLEAIKGGMPFEEAAKKRLGNFPEGSTPWDLGWLKLLQMPEAWRSQVATLKDGQLSPVIRGGKRLAWIVKVLGRRQASNVTFDTEKAPLMSMLKGQKLEQLRAQIDDELRKSAKIELFTPKPPPEEP